MNIPIGEVFEVFVKGLKAHCGGFFESLSSGIDFSITVIERILSMDVHHVYPPVVVFVLISFFSYLLIRKKLATKIALVLGIALFFVLGASELWRRDVVSETVTTAEAARVSAVVLDYKALLAQEGSLELAKQEDRINRRLVSRFNSVKQPRLKRDLLGIHTFEKFEEHMQAFDSEAKDKKVFSDDLLSTKAELELLISEYDPERLNGYAFGSVMILLVLLAWCSAGFGLAIFAFLGLSLIHIMGYWSYTTDTLALVMSATGFALVLGVPLGIMAAANKTVDRISKPALDLMQTMPAFVYLIPAVLLFGLGKVPGAMATLIFAMPPAVRLTSLGIRSVPVEVVEAAQAFGSTPWQLLIKAQLPIALPTILAGLNQTIMLALSMVVIGGMIGAGGLGEVVLSGITQLKIGLGFESGLSVVILAIYLDRLTQSLGRYKS